MKTISNQELKLLPHEFQVLFAIFCRQVIHLVAEKDREVCLAAILAAEGFVEGRVTVEECKVAANAAYDYANAAYAAYTAAYAANAAYAAADAAAYAAANAAYAAYAAANAADAAAYANKAVVKEQWDYYNELLTFEEEFEKIILG